VAEIVFDLVRRFHAVLAGDDRASRSASRFTYETDQVQRPPGEASRHFKAPYELIALHVNCHEIHRRADASYKLPGISAVRAKELETEP
jgi:hypothetical protein